MTTVNLPADRPWTPTEAIAYLRMDTLRAPRQMLCRYVKEGKLKAWRRGRLFLFTKAQLDAFLALHY